MIVRLIFFILFCLPAVAAAHKSSDSYLFLTGSSSSPVVQWDIALRDLDLLIGLDTNRDRKITWGEVKASSDHIFSQAMAHLKFEAESHLCQLEKTGLMINQHSDGAYATLGLAANCSGKNLTHIRYNFLFEQDPDHRGVLLDKRESAVLTPMVFSPEKTSMVIDTKNSNLWSTFTDYFKEGVWHIWKGFDHVLFILMLMLPSVLLYRNKKWQAVTDFRQAGKDLLKVITAFTIAHSITLSLSVLQLLSLPSRLVESVIAVSIIVVALNNLKPLFSKTRWILVFGFGLMHGFGFASVLVDLGLPAHALATSLLAFNLGVEAGQLVIVCLVFPLVWLLRDSLFYRTAVLKGGSVFVSLFALVWVVERTFNVQIGFM